MWFDFNDNWLFSDGKKEERVDLPHDAMIHEQRYETCRSGADGAYFPGGKYRYMKKFPVEKEQLNKITEVRFEGVYRNALISVNGKQVMQHAYGYGEFVVDISSYLLAGENKIAVDVDNSLVPNSRWYSGSGIYRPVAMRIKETDLGELKIKTVSYDPAVVSVLCSNAELVQLYEKDHLIAEGRPGLFEVNDAELWSADSPHLYRAVAVKGKDKREENFGIRKLEYSPQYGLRVNGVPTVLMGGCLHHDNGILGACGFKDAEYRKVRLMKENGFNAVRISHNPASRHLLEACDELGMYVIDEAFDGWFTPKTYHDFSRDFYDNYQAEVRAMVNKDYNHPSVIMYSIGNEVTEPLSDEGKKVMDEMVKIIHEMDDERPAMCAINVLLNVYASKGIGIYKDKGDYVKESLPEDKKYKEIKSGSSFFNALTQKLGTLMFVISKGKTAEKICADTAKHLDVLGLNYASSRYDRDVAKYPDRLMVGSETMVADLPYNHERVLRYPQLLGDFVWSAIDYLGEACFGDWTYESYKGLPLLAGQGMIDITGYPLAQMHFMQVVWGKRKTPFIAVSPLNHSDEIPRKASWQFTNAINSWNWQGYEGKRTKVEVYARGKKVRLSLNGEEVGVKTLKDFRCSFITKYAPGILQAEVLDGQDQVISSGMLSSGTEETELRVKTDKTLLKADNQSMCFAEIEFVDREGNLKPYYEQRVEIEVEGCVSLAGFGSALCKTDEVFDKNYHNSYRGRCLAAFRAGKEKGKAIITIRSQGVKDASFEIEVE